MGANPTLRVYRSLLRVAASMSSEQRLAALEEARSEIAFFRNLSDSQEIARQVKIFEDKVAFVRMQTPKLQRQQSGRTRIVYGKDGTKHVNCLGTLPEKARWTNWDGKNMDPDSVARHHHTLKRAGFVNNAHAKGFF
mmetsp:Transcript_19291/g.25041  ORF Transcript_19291/g.25041 Transcript_19291/m.25041 type:complete len:137 (+) Transcript_19291:63-473(+)